MKVWTTKEILYIQKHSLLAETNEVLNIKEMAKKLNRTTQSVRNKIYSLQRDGELPKVNRENSFDTQNRPWSKTEDKRLIAMDKNGATGEEIAESLNRTVGSVYSRKSKLIKQKKLSNSKSVWTDRESQLLIENIQFDENGYVSNYDELGKITNKQYQQLVAKVSRLRKSGDITVKHNPESTSVKAKKAMNHFNDARFAHVTKEDGVVDKIPEISIKSQEVTLILTTTIINGIYSEQYFTKDGQMIAEKKPTPAATDVSQ